MTIRLGLAALAYLVPSFALGFVWHLILFKEHYAALAIYRADIIVPFGLILLVLLFRPAGLVGTSHVERV